MILALALLAADPAAAEGLDFLFAEDVSTLEAIDLATLEAGREDLRDELRRICKREAWCGRFRHVKIHEGDAWAGSRFYVGAVRRGWLDPDQCPAHARPESRDEFAQWSVRGAFGMAAAYHVRHLVPYLGECVAPEVLDHPGVAAWAAVLYIEDLCKRTDVCDCPGRARQWAGAGNWGRRTYARNRESVVKQCGDAPELQDWELLADTIVITWKHVSPWHRVGAGDQRALERAWSRRFGGEA